MTTWQLERGASLLENGGIRFAVWAPHVDHVAVQLIDGSRERTLPMERDSHGVHQLVVTDLEPGADYCYCLEGERIRPDPVSRHQPGGVHGPSRVVDPSEHMWSDGAWKGISARDLVLYELHVGTFTDTGTFAGVVEKLSHLKQLGITALELMPVAEFPGRRNWGYDGVNLYAPHSAYGGPSELKRLVDAAHQEGLAVILDVVYNHLGPEGNYLGEYGPYFTDRYHTPWGQAVNFDGPHSNDVRRYVIDNALYWITEYHIDGLRLDAVHAIFDFSAQHILAELTEQVHAEGRRMGRTVHVIAESDLNDPRLVRTRAYGGFGLDAQWSDDFHHAVHATLTGERAGYYVDFDRTEHVAKALRDRFVLDGKPSSYRRRRHGTSATDIPADRFVIFVQNHDQIGNRATGDRLTTLVSFGAVKLAAALVLLSPYVPLLFMGEEHGETNPFLYFVSHEDPELVEAVRRGRREEFAAFGWRGDIPDPQARDTFERSRIDWGWPSNPARAAIHRLYRALLRIRREEPALRAGTARVDIEDGTTAGWISVLYTTREGAPLVAAFNLSPLPCVAPIPWNEGRWQLRLFTEHEQYGGSGLLPAVLDQDEQPGTMGLALPAHCAALYRKDAA
jgi:maltooligosyltrehalose trehalohydrolase